MKEKITRQELEQAFVEKHTREHFAKMKNSKVGIAGLGGLGSNIAVMLTRAGIGHLKLVDFDRVDVTNLNRQLYTTEHLGLLKAEALKEMLLKINPFMEIETEIIKIDETNVHDIFRDFEVVCEAFDVAEYKAMLIGALLSGNDTVKIFSGSGMAGTGSGNWIRTEKKMNRLFVSGDFVSDVHEQDSLWSTRVQICAAHQAHMIVRTVLGFEEV